MEQTNMQVSRAKVWYHSIPAPNDKHFAQKVSAARL